MDRYYIYIEEMIGISSGDASYMAENEDEAVTKYIQDKNNNFDEEDRWRLFANKNPNYLKEYYEWEKECEEYEIVGRRPIEL